MNSGIDIISFMKTGNLQDVALGMEIENLIGKLGKPQDTYTPDHKSNSRKVLKFDNGLQIFTLDRVVNKIYFYLFDDSIVWNLPPLEAFDYRSLSREIRLDELLYILNSYEIDWNINKVNGVKSKILIELASKVGIVYDIEYGECEKLFISSGG